MITDGGLLYSQIDSQLPQFIQTDHAKFSKFIEKYYEFLELNLITFTDLDLNEDAILQEKANTTFTITVATGNNAYSNSVNKFYVDGEVSPIITLTSGAHAIFDQGDDTNIGHYFHISKTPNGIHTAGGKQFTTDDRGDVLFTYTGEPGDYNNVTLEAEDGILLYEDYLDSATTLDNLTLEDASGILLYEDDVEIGFETTPDREIGLESSSTIQFYVSPDLVGETLYYYCNNHSGMGGNITVSTATTYISQENGNTDSANTSTTDYVTIESPSRQGDQFLSGEIILGANSGATGIVKGKYSNTQAYVEETNFGAFEVGENITGKTSRATATVNSYSRQPINASRNVKSFQDIDKAPAGFVELFRKEFLTGFSKNTDISTSNLLKNIKDFYRSKGNENSFRYIFRLLFGIEEVDFFYPGQDIMRLSDGRWTLDKSVKILTDSASYVDSFLGKTIVGGTSNVSALVERVERYAVGALDITELFLSGFDANNANYQATEAANYTTFFLGETLTANSADDDGNFATATSSGVLQSVTIDFGGSGYEKGNELQVIGGGGTGAKAKIGSIAAAALTGIDVIDSGDGYTVGDVVDFVNDGTGGTGGTARVDTIVKTANVFTQAEIINTFGSSTINAAAFAAPWGSFNRNTHSSSNSTTTFTVPFDGLSGTTPKQGDFIAEFGSGESITLYTPGTSKFGTVVSTNSTSITYGLGSIDYQTTHNVDPTLNNFADDDAITIFDLSKDEDGSAVTSNGYNATIRATGATFNINGTPAANTDTTYHGAFTMQESEIGGVRSVQILSSGQGYETVPPVSVSNNEIFFYGGAPEKVGANSIFVNLANTIANTFTANTLVKNATNNAFGIVLDFLDLASTTLAETGNTTLRIQMTSANTFSSNDTLTSYSRLDSSPTGIGDFGTANISTSGTTATFTQADHGFGAGERIVITGSTSGTDAAVYNNNHTIAGITNSSTYTVTLASDPTDDSETSLTVRKIVTANVVTDLILTEDSTTTQLSLENGIGTANDDYSSSTSNGSIRVESGIDEANATFANTGIPGNNAVISIAELAVGAIETVLVYDFGAGYSSAPTISAAAVGDGSATLAGNVGVYAEYTGYFNGENGLLSGTNRMQDNLYYQDFSYVVKTDKDVATYRDKILELVHPAGMALFGEILMRSSLSVQLFDNATSNINSIQANTVLVANSVDASLYNYHEVEFYTSNTVSTNNQVLVESSYEFKSFSSGIFAGPENDARMDSTGSSSDFDLQLEHGNDLFSLEVSGFFLAFENTGELLLEQDISGGVGDRLIEETADFLLTEDNIVRTSLEDGTNDNGDILLLEDSTTTNNNISHEGVFLHEENDGSVSIIYDFQEAELGSVITEDGDGIEINLTGSDSVTIEEYNGDFIVLDSSRNLIHINLEGDITEDILLEDGSTSTPHTSTDGYLLNEESDDSGTLDGAYFVQEDEAGEFTQGFKIQQEGNFTEVVTEGRLIQEDDTFVLLEKQTANPAQLGLEPTTPDAFSGLQETVYVELEQAIGGDSAVRADNISHFVFEEDEDLLQTLRLDSEDGDLLYEDGLSVLLEIQGLAETVRIRNEDEASTFKLEDFDSALELETNTDGIQEGRNASTQSFFLFEDDDSSARAYLLEEPTTLYQNIQSEDPFDQFVIVTDNESDTFGDVTDTIILEIEEFVTDTTIKGESYESGTGFLLPMLIFPTAESGSALLDLSFTSRIVIEIDDIQNVRIEEYTGEFILQEDENYFVQEDEAGEFTQGFKIQQETFFDSSAGGDLLYEDNCAVLYEQQEVTSVGYQYDLILLEESDGTNPVYIATESSMTEEVDTLREIDIVSDGTYQLILENVFGSHENGFLVYENGGITLESGTNAEGNILFENGDRSLLEDGVEDKIGLVQPSVAASVRTTHSLLQSGDTLGEGSFLTRSFGNRTYGSVALSDLSNEFELLTEDGKSYVSEASATSDPDNLITEFYERGVVATGTATQFEFDFNNLIVLEGTENGVIEMEAATPEENSIILEGNDPDVFALLQQEDGSKIFTEEDIHTLIPAPERLCGVGLHDLILEEEAIVQEASDQIKLEDFTLDNITLEDAILGEFVPFIGFETHPEATDFEAAVSIDDNVLLESATHRTENICIVTETSGHLIVDEEDGSSHFVVEDFYFKYFSEGTITQNGTVITISGSTFPSAVVNGGRFYYQNGEEITNIVSLSDTGLELTVENSTTISSAEHFKIEYALDETPADAEAVLVMEAFTLDPTVEVVGVDLIFNGVGDISHGFTRNEDTDGFGTFTLAINAFTDIIGNDVVFEDGERVLAEDSIGGYIAFEDSAQNVSLGIAHSKVLNEDDTGGFISTQDHEGNETTQDDNVLMKELSDALLLEDSETEILNYVLSEEDGQMMLEDVLQVSEHKIVLNSSDSILIEDQPDGANFNYRLLNLDMGRFDIETVANNTSLTIQSTDSSDAATDFFKRSDSAILVSRTEQIV